MTQADVMVVGGGAAGLMAAIAAAESGRSVLVIEKNNVLARKFRGSGGQFTNTQIGPENYHDDGDFAWSICRRFGPEQVRAFFAAVGVELVGPQEGQTGTTLQTWPGPAADALESRLRGLNIIARTGTEVRAIRPPGSGEDCFSVETADGQTFRAGKVIVAAGGRGYPQLGAEQTGLLFLRRLGHTIIPQYAASTRTVRPITHIPGPYMDWKDVFVTGGGVSTGEVDRDTLESLLFPGLYFAGEALNIAGDRGGYNLQFAFASGRLAGQTQHAEAPHPALFSPVTVGPLRLKNRVVMPAMATGFGFSSPQGQRYFALRARSGVGLIICGQVSLSWLEKHAGSDELKQLVEIVHAAGAKIGIQWTAERRDLEPLTGNAPSGAAEVDSLPEDALRLLPTLYAAAAVRAQCAGFDMIELHGAHSSLLARFASPKHNRRTDAYGGSRENRHRLSAEVARAVKIALGPETLVAYRLNAEEVAEGGATADDGVALAKRLVACGVGLIDVSKCGANVDKGGEGIICPSAKAAEGTHVESAGKIRRALGVPVIGVGRVQNPAFADKAVREGVVDLVAVGRGQLADPAWAAKARKGRGNLIVKCLGCNKCMTSLFSGKSIACPQNPTLGTEAEGESVGKNTGKPG